MYLFLTGLITISWPLVGLVITLSNRHSLAKKVAVVSFCVFLSYWVYTTTGQLRVIAENPASSAISQQEHLLLFYHHLI